MIIGVTGPSGAGKSLVCRHLAEAFGFWLIDCDEYARKAVCDKMLTELTESFGKQILNDDGTLNRRALAAAAFASKELTDRLNSITHPYIIGLVERDIDNYKNVILDAPTLFESGLDKRCDATFAVLASKELRSSRILLRDKLTQSQLDDRQKAAKADEFYTTKTDRIIINNGDIEALKSAAEKMLGEIIGGKL